MDTCRRTRIDNMQARGIAAACVPIGCSYFDMLEAPLLDCRTRRARWSLGSALDDRGKPPHDQLGRPLHDLRISVIDQCNFRCSYCMPRDVFGTDYAFLRRDQLLSFDEIERLARLFVALGVRKIRISGGEPLLRKGIEDLVDRLAGLKTTTGLPVDLAMTTNGALLAHKASALAAAGLKRLNVSLDALDVDTFQRMTDTPITVDQILQGIATASKAGIKSIKVNMVVRRSLNDHQILPMARYFRYSGHVLRFIEFMDVGSTNGWSQSAVVPSTEVLSRIDRDFRLEPMEPAITGEVARRWRYQDGAGEIGVISSVSSPFCGDCSRARISAEGKLYACLFAQSGIDLRQLLRGADDDVSLRQTIESAWHRRNDRYSEIRHLQPRSRKIEMSYIGG